MNGKKEATEAETLIVTGKLRRWILFAGVTLIVAGIFSYFASPHPDGLMRVAEDNGFLPHASEPKWKAWISGYKLPGVHSAWLKVGLAGVIGAALLFLILFGISWLTAKRKEVRHVGESDHHAP